MAIMITSPAFKDGETIPRKYSCDGQNISPPLTWQDLPEGTQSLALIVDDPDAPSGNWVHWVLYDLPGDLDSLPESCSGVGIECQNDFHRPAYGGPCPPRGKPHRYFFKLYALDTILKLPAGAKKPELERAMQGHVLAQGQLMGKYQRL